MPPSIGTGAMVGNMGNIGCLIFTRSTRRLIAQEPVL